MPAPTAQQKPGITKTSHFSAADGAPSALAATVARNLCRLREHRGYSLDLLAERTGIDVPALDQVEAGKGEPPLESAWKIATALDVPFAALIADQAPRGAVVMRKNEAKVIVSEDLGLTTPALLPFEDGRRVEFYEWRLAPHHREASAAHALGTREFLFVANGTVEVTVGREPDYLVSEGDTIGFPADLPHGYRNVMADPASLFGYEVSGAGIITTSNKDLRPLFHVDLLGWTKVFCNLHDLFKHL
jgi:transcriptional regulator with XRE-family HTH domain